MERGNDGARGRPLMRNLAMHSEPGAFWAVRQSQPVGDLRNGWGVFPNRAEDPVLLPFTRSELVTDGHDVGGPPPKFAGRRAFRHLEHHVTVYLFVRVEG